MQARPKFSTRPVDDRVSVGAAMIHDTVMNAKAPGKQRGTAGQTRHITRMHVLKNTRPTSYCINVRAGLAMIAIATQMVGTQSIDVDIKYAHVKCLDRTFP